MYFIDKQSGKGNDSFCFYEDDGVVKFANIDKDAIVWSYKIRVFILPLMWLLGRETKSVTLSVVCPNSACGKSVINDLTIIHDLYYLYQ